MPLDAGGLLYLLIVLVIVIVIIVVLFKVLNIALGIAPISFENEKIVIENLPFLRS